MWMQCWVFMSSSPEDQPRFVALAPEEFKTLHAGNVIRFGLRPLEFAAWKEQGARS